MKVGDRVRNKYPAHETGIVIRIDDSSVNPNCILVKIDGEPKDDDWGLFKESHLEVLDVSTPTSST